MMKKIPKSDITGVVLAGGQARRMGGQDKGLIILKGKPMIEYVIDVLKLQVDILLINANRNHDKYSGYGFDIVPDELSGYCGPLAGMASSLSKIETPYLVTAPCDTPFIPDDLVQRLVGALESKNADISVAHNGERIQPVFCLLKKDLLSSINDFLNQGERKIDRWFNQHALAVADFSDIPKTFDNFNTPEDLETAENEL